MTVSSLFSQLKLTGASLSQIQALLLGEEKDLKPEVVDAFDTTLTACLVLTTWLDQYMQDIEKGVLAGSKKTWKAKFRTVWNESDVEELMNQLLQQQAGISALVSLLQM